LQGKTDLLAACRIDPDSPGELEFVIVNLGGRWLNAGLKQFGEIVGVDLIPILRAFRITEPGSPFEHPVG
jgi:hypothetical protein